MFHLREDMRGGEDVRMRRILPQNLRKGEGKTFDEVDRDTGSSSSGRQEWLGHENQHRSALHEPNGRGLPAKRGAGARPALRGRRSELARSRPGRDKFPRRYKKSEERFLTAQADPFAG